MDVEIMEACDQVKTMKHSLQDLATPQIGVGGIVPFAMAFFDPYRAKDIQIHSRGLVWSWQDYLRKPYGRYLLDALIRKLFCKLSGCF